MLAGTAILFLAGCLELEEKYMVNPDGSGKFFITYTLDSKKFPGAAQAPEKFPSAEKWLQALVQESEGIDVWSAASSESRTDGKIVLKVEGYFKSIAKLKFGGPHPMALAQPVFDKTGITASPLFDPRGFIGPAHLAAKAGRPRQLTTQATAIFEALLNSMEATDVLTNEPLEKIPGNLSQNLPQILDVLADARYTAYFNFGAAEVKSSSGFEQVNPHTVRMYMKLDQLARKGDGAHSLMTSGTQPSKSRTLMLDLLNLPFARSATPPKAIIEGDQPVFDYPAEVNNARSAQTAALKQLLIK